MSTIYDYRYYIEGRQIAILSRGSSTTYNPDITTNTDIWQTPTQDDSDVVMINYSYSPTVPTSESDTIDLNNFLSLALVDYVKYRLFEDEGDEKRSQLYYNKFLRRINQNENNKIGSLRRSIPAGVAVLK